LARLMAVAAASDVGSLAVLHFVWTIALSITLPNGCSFDILGRILLRTYVRARSISAKRADPSGEENHQKPLPSLQKSLPALLLLFPLL